MRSRMKQMLYDIAAVVLITTSKWVKIPLAWAGSTYLFSLFSLTPPLLARLVTKNQLMLLFALASGAYVLGMPMLIMSGAPTIAAALLWQAYNDGRSRIVIQVFLPMLCMFLFVVHPVGSHVPTYALFWLIPIAGLLLSTSRGMAGLIATACSSTFVAHAVGSVLWLYQMPSTPDLWHGLIAVVPLERLLMSVGLMAAQLGAHGMWRSNQVVATTEQR